MKRLFGFTLILITLLSSCKEDFKGNENIVESNNDSTYTLALDELNKRILKEPNNAVHYYQRSNYYKENNKVEEALNDMKRVMNIDSNNSVYRVAYGEALFLNKELRPAIRQFKAASEIDKESTEARLKLAEINFLLRNYQESLNNLDDVLKIDRYNPDAYLMKGFVFLENRDTTRAVSSFETAREVEPNNYEANIELAKLYESANDKRAIDYYNTAINIDPTSVEALYSRGLAAFNWGAPELARNSFDLVIKISENKELNSVELRQVQLTYYNLGRLEAQYYENYQAAAKMFTLAFQLDQKHADAIYNRGLCYEFLGEYNKAKADYLTALEIDGQHDKAARSLNIVLDKIQ